LPGLLEEKKQLDEAHSEILKLASGKHDYPKKIDFSACRPQPGQKDVQGTPMEVYHSLQEAQKKLSE